MTITSFAVILVGALLLTGCTGPEPGGDGTPLAAPSTGTAVTPQPAESGAEELSEFEQQLPLQGEFVSQHAATTGSVLIERRADGSTWVVFEGFTTDDAPDVRLHLKEGALEQDDTGAWVDTAGMSFEIAPLDPAAPRQEIEIAGADIMPTIRTLTVMSYSAPDYPSLGSVALAP